MSTGSDEQGKSGLKPEENRAITTARLQAMRHRAHQLINHLTAISGYTQLALTRKPGSCINTELEKIVKTVNRASKEVLSWLASLNEVEKG